jgi:hypothetical protein
MKRLFTLGIALLFCASLALAQATGGSTGKPDKGADTTSGKKKHHTKGHKGGKKHKKGSGDTTTTPPPK